MVKGGQICQVERIIASIEYQEKLANKRPMSEANSQECAPSPAFDNAQGYGVRLCDKIWKTWILQSFMTHCPSLKKMWSSIATIQES